MKRTLLSRLYREEENGLPAAGGGDTPAENTSSADWAALAEDNDDVIEGEFSVGGDTEIATQPPAAEAPAKPASSVNGEQPAQPAATPAQPAAPAATEQPAQPATPAATEQPATPAAEAPAEFNWQEWHDKSVEQLLPQYALTDEEASQMLTEPEKVLPRMAASLHTRVIQNVLAHLPQVLPGLIQQISQTQTTEMSLRDKFYSINDDLVDAKYHASIAQAGQFYRSLNPTVDADTAAFHVGNLVRQAYGMPLKEKAGGAPQQAQPAATANTATQPFSPAQGGHGGAAPQTSDNPFTAFAEEIANS